MDKDGPSGMIIVLGIIALALLGGVKNVGPILPPVSGSASGQNQISIDQKTREIQSQLNDVKQQIQIIEDEKTRSQYRNIVSLSFVNRSANPNQEYVAIRVSGNATGAISVTGWVLKSLSTGAQVSIPQGTYLYFTGMSNAKDNIALVANDALYLITGVSPIGANFKVNKCSGYLGQFQTFVPYLNNNCPLPKNEDLSEIPKLTINDACFDFIDTLGRCRIQTTSLPTNWSTECKNFILNKINYPSCINTHKNDSDFYQKEWRVYLNRDDRIWKDRRESIVLYDNIGKVVDILNY